MNGRLFILRAAACATLQALLCLTVSAQVQNTESSATAQNQTAATAPAPTREKTIGEVLGQGFSNYEPIYFVVGTRPAAEFQFSLKYHLFGGTETPLLRDAYIAYTQTSFWDLLISDPRFYDTSYKPSAFFYHTNIFNLSEDRGFHLDLQGGVEHESNGDGGANERSIWTTYVQPTARIDLSREFHLMLQPRAWIYFDVGNNNPDIAQYRGYADLRTALTWNNPIEQVQLSARLRVGDEGAHPGLLVALRFNIPYLPHYPRFNPAFQVQYFTGYGQSFLQYNQYSTGFRAGLCLWYD